MFKTISFNDSQLYCLIKLSQLSFDELHQLLEPYNRLHIEKSRTTKIKKFIASTFNTIPDNVKILFEGYSLTSEQIINLSTVSQLPELFIYNILNNMKSVENSNVRTKKQHYPR